MPKEEAPGKVCVNQNMSLLRQEMIKFTIRLTKTWSKHFRGDSTAPRSGGASEAAGSWEGKAWPPTQLLK